MKHDNNFSEKGLTLIELLIVMTIIGVMATLGMTSFISYNKSQTLSQAHANVSTAIALAKSRAQSQVIPPGCTGVLNGYRVYINSTQYRVAARCGSNDVITVGPKDYPSGVTGSTVNVNGSNWYQFDTLTGSVKQAASTGSVITIRQSATVYKTITIYIDGRIEAN